MKISFTLGGGQDIRINQIAPRVLTENFLRNDKFEPTFLNFPLICAYHAFKDVSKYRQQIGEKNKALVTCEALWWNSLKISLGHYKYTNLLLNELKTDYLFYSCSLTLLEIKIISAILNSGIRLIIGGALINNFSFEDIRDRLSKIVDQRYMKNLLIVKGYVDLTTDLYKIVEKWEDCVIDNNDFSTFWECEKDYIVDKIKIFRKFDKHIDLSFLELYSAYQFKTSVYIFDSDCWWGKCKFCSSSSIDGARCIIDFTKGASIEKVSENIINGVKKHNSEGIFIANDYFMFNDKYEKILQNLVDSNVKISIFTGIKALQNKKYIKKINKYMNYLRIGLESLSDFSLDYINKGYNYKDIQDTVVSIKNNMNRDIVMTFNLILDLPEKSEKDVILNYERASQLKNELREAGFTTHHSSRLLVVPKWDQERLIDNKYLTINTQNKNISGRYLIFNYFKELNILTDDLYKDALLPLLRYDEKGNELKSDIFIVPYDLANRAFTWD